MTDAAMSAPVMKDRRTGLVVFGILELLLAGLCLMEVGFMGLVLVFRDALPQASRSQFTAGMILPTMLFYLALGISFVLLGVGSIRCRRWARSLVHILSAGWLAIGVPVTLFLAFTMPRIMAAVPAQPGMGTDARRGVIFVATAAVTVLFGLLFVVIPGALFLFYRSPHVKATCEARDPHLRWTDTCPAPVLGLALLLGTTGVYGLLTVPTYRTFPLFGIPVEGFPAQAMLALLFGNSIVLGRFIYRMRAWAFWTSVVLSALWVLSGLLSFQRLGLEGLMKLSGQSPDPQAIALLKAMPPEPLFALVAFVMALWAWLYWAAGRAILRTSQGENHEG